MMGWGPLFCLKANVGVRENEKQAEISLTSAVKFLWIALRARQAAA
jgi:hypothetical protein